MFLSQSVIDPQRYRVEQMLYDDMRASFDDPLPLRTSTEIHPFMVAGHEAENKVKQEAILSAIEHQHSDVKERGLKLAQAFTVAQHDPNPPKPGQPGYKPQPGQPIHTPPAQPNVPGTPGYDPTKPVTDAPQEQPAHHDNP